MITIPLAKQGKTTEPLKVKLENYQWTCLVKPQTEASLLMTEQGLHVKFEVQESSPLTTSKVQQEPMLMVCQDSAVELFLAFSDLENDQNFKPALEHCMYTNIEINSAGICYAKYGHSRKNRTAFSPEQIASLQIKTTIQDNKWSCELIVPRSLVKEMAGYDAFDGIFALNLYKISESKEVEHYISFNRIEVDKPNFHLPEFFALAQCQ